MADVITSGRVSFRDVLRNREYRSLWIADAQSMAGDQLARVALSVLVFERTSSSVLTALTYALTFLPALVGGAMLAGIADRMPRRRVMIGCDVLRAGLLGLMAIPALPVWAVSVLLVLAVLAGSPFSAAESALLPDLLDGERYVVATGLRTITNQMAQLAGFAGGGVAVAIIGPHAGLGVDAVTFAVSALLITVGVRPRPVPRLGTATGEPEQSYLASIAAAIRLVARQPKLRTLLAFSWLLGLYVVPEGIAPAYASSVGAGAVGMGLLMAAGPAGTALGTYLFVRLVPAAVRSRWIGPIAIAGGIPLALCAFRPGLVLSIVLWAISGAGAAYQVQVAPDYVRAVPDERRAQAIGVAASGLLASQGIGILLGGFIAAGLGPAPAVAWAGGVAAMLAGWLTVAWCRMDRRAKADDGSRSLSN
ncbi:MFS transporter [Jatrophihabitans lederbergiae]|uniref:MFS transporter n=1 Tax=Jatrophihabitans lederbergiae TaxID=3075547 RepID=A0ABU2J8D9_9ACTN|nr:MFS transporter [Jatrophihabitans sp. DSM 44399]MDT0260983.1 MFS transporter [Jatrophihabitans sp. DSM 44399]